MSATYALSPLAPTTTPTLPRIAGVKLGAAQSGVRYKDRDDVAVVTISMDVDKAVPEARAFIAEHSPLAFYADPKFQLPFEFPGKGAMPQTIVLDRQGRIRAVMMGEADWSSHEAHALFVAILAEGGAPPPA